MTAAKPVLVTATASLPGPWTAPDGYTRLGGLAPGEIALVDPSAPYVKVCLDAGLLQRVKK